MKLVGLLRLLSLAMPILCLGTPRAAPRGLADESMSMAARHEQWTAQYGRVYAGAAEKELRFRIFKANVEYIEAFNGAGNHTYTLGVNRFADLTHEEFVASRLGLNPNLSTNKAAMTAAFRYANATNVPPSMDWRSSGAVTPVKNQHGCGCCWAFSAVAAIEGITQLSTGQLLSLSEQELLDCDEHNGNNGCTGGLMDRAFKYAVGNGGLSSEAAYTYTGVEGPCNATKKSVASISGYEDVPRNSEAALLQAVANQPVSIGIDGQGHAFGFYSGGVFSGPCGTEMTHAVTAVGYGATADGTKYWLLKNSWGTSWGEGGYMRLLRDVAAAEGLCGITELASYPIH